MHDDTSPYMPRLERQSPQDISAEYRRNSLHKRFTEVYRTVDSHHRQHRRTPHYHRHSYYERTAEDKFCHHEIECVSRLVQQRVLPSTHPKHTLDVPRAELRICLQEVGRERRKHQKRYHHHKQRQIRPDMSRVASNAVYAVHTAVDGKFQHRKRQQKHCSTFELRYYFTVSVVGLPIMYAGRKM